MPSAAVIATIADHSSRSYTLTAGMWDLNVTGKGADPWRVPMDTISVTEAGFFGGASSMRFRVWDPTVAVNLQEGALVEFTRVASGVRVFGGLVQSLGYSTEAVGRWIEVECVGPEMVLDWMLVPSLTIPAGTRVYVAFQAAAANATGLGLPLHWGHATDSQFGDQDNPIGAVGFDDLNAPTTKEAITFAGESLGECLRRISEIAPWDALYGQPEAYGQYTVDLTWGLRLFRRSVSFAPDDYAALTVNDQIAGPIAASSLRFNQSFLSVVHAVYIKGGNAAGTGLVTDGTGIPGPIPYIEDSTITTAAKRDLVGYKYLGQQSDTDGGELIWEANTASATQTPTSHIAAGSLLTLTDPNVGLEAQPFRISSIDKSWVTTDRETWRISFGRPRPRFSRQFAYKTRGIRS